MKFLKEKLDFKKLPKIDFKKIPKINFKSIPKIKLSKKMKIVLAVVLVLLIVLIGVMIKKHSSAKKAASEQGPEVSIVTRGTLINSITGSGTVEPIEQREIVPLVNGKITEAPFEEGATVKEGDVLYRFEMTAAENAIKTAQNAVKSAENNVSKARTTLENRRVNIKNIEENIANLTIKATESGRISDLNLVKGEEISGKVCTITNYKEQTATLPFNSAQIKKINIGDSASVSVEKYMINVRGKVVRKYTAPEPLSDGTVLYNAEIKIEEDVYLDENVEVTATVHTANGDISSASYGKVKYAPPLTVNAEQRGKVSSIKAKSGDWIEKGEVIAVLTNNDITQELKNAKQSYSEAQMSLSDSQNNLENARSNLEDKQEAAQDYILTSPINGVILTKDYKTGDTVSGQNATKMMVVADMSKMRFTISVDELDISKIAEGQSVKVTADALEGEILSGTITSVSRLGTASNGVTTYPIEVTIDNPGSLMPGMNVSAEIIVEQAQNTLMLPLEAVEFYGGKYYVTVVGKAELPDFSAMRQGKTTGGEKENKKENSEMPKDSGEQKSAWEGTKPSGEQKSAWEGAKPSGEQKSAWEGAKPSGEQRGAWQGFKPGEKAQGENSETGEKQGENKERPTFPKEGSPSMNNEKAPEEKEEGKKAEKGEKDSSGSAETKNNQTKKGTANTPGSKGGFTGGRTNASGGFGGTQGKMPNWKDSIKYNKKEERVEVQVGISNDQYYEIKGGIEFGAVVKNTGRTASTQAQGGFGRMGGFGGMGGGMPSRMGGMSGGFGGMTGRR